MRQGPNNPIVWLSLLVVTCGGCAMCANPFDECYPAYGGSRPRADMLAGRVGSAFVEAGLWSEADKPPTEPTMAEEPWGLDSDAQKVGEDASDEYEPDEYDSGDYDSGGQDVPGVEYSGVEYSGDNVSIELDDYLPDAAAN